MSFVRKPTQARYGGDTARSLSNGLKLLGAFRPGEQYLGNKELAERTQLPRSTVSRLTGVLIQSGYLTYCPRRGRYALGTALLSIVNPMLISFKIRHIARPFMKRLADEVSGSVSLGVRERYNLIYIETSKSPLHTVSSPEIGAVVPLLSSAMGHAYLASLSKPKFIQLCAELRDADSSEWHAKKGALDHAAADMNDYGFVRCFGKILPDTRSCGVALRVPANGEFMVMNCGVSVHSYKKGQLENHIGPKLLKTAREIESAVFAASERLIA